MDFCSILHPESGSRDGKACVLATYEKIAKLDGVAAATVDFQEGRVIALIDSSKTTQPAWEDALKKRGLNFLDRKMKAGIFSISTGLRMGSFPSTLHPISPTSPSVAQAR